MKTKDCIIKEFEEECSKQRKEIGELRARMKEANDRHQLDCIRINQLQVALDIVVERYQKLREVHGL